MAIHVSDITNITDTGIFDQLMAAVNKHIDYQYLNNRITGSDYATVYLGSMQAVLAQSVQFALQDQLVEAQITKTLEDTRNVYTDRVVKDKTAAKLGLDNVMKQSEESRTTDSNFVYTPRYENGV